jgi:hypothetical protein
MHRNGGKAMSPSEVKKETLKTLRQTRNAMMTAAWMDALKKKSAEERQEAALKLLDVNSAMHELQNSVLADIRDKLIANEAALLNGIAGLGKALDNLNQVKKVINSVGKVLDVVAKVVKFVATHV